MNACDVPGFVVTSGRSGGSPSLQPCGSRTGLIALLRHGCTHRRYRGITGGIGRRSYLNVGERRRRHSGSEVVKDIAFSSSLGCYSKLCLEIRVESSCLPLAWTSYHRLARHQQQYQRLAQDGMHPRRKISNVNPNAAHGLRRGNHLTWQSNEKRYSPWETGRKVTIVLARDLGLTTNKQPKAATGMAISLQCRKQPRCHGWQRTNERCERSQGIRYRGGMHERLQSTIPVAPTFSHSVGKPRQEQNTQELRERSDEPTGGKNTRRRCLRRTCSPQGHVFFQ